MPEIKILLQIQPLILNNMDKMVIFCRNVVMKTKQMHFFYIILLYFSSSFGLFWSFLDLPYNKFQLKISPIRAKLERVSLKIAIRLIPSAENLECRLSFTSFFAALSVFQVIR